MTTPITSKDNPRVKLAHGLQQSPRMRRSERKLVVEGVRLLRDVLSRKGKPEYVLYDLKQVDYDLLAQLQEREVNAYPVSEDILKYISDTQQPQGMLAVLPVPRLPIPKTPRAVLILDAIREPGNMGTILRTTAASGADLVILSPDCVDVYNPKVLRAGMGAHWRIPLVEAEWQEIAGFTEHMNVYLATGSAEQVYTSVDFQQAWALVIGNEAHGAQNAKRLNPKPIRIPMAADSESLNAAAATAVILFEAARQRAR